MPLSGSKEKSGSGDPAIIQRPEPDATRGTFDLEINGQKLGFLSYSLDDEAMVVDYVQVDPSLRGQGMGEKLVCAAVEWARANHRKIVPICSYARAVMKRTPEYRDVFQP
jgi:predicted GNAT family acetyltransferase